MCGGSQGFSRWEEEGQGRQVKKQCPEWLHDLLILILRQGKESVVQTWERLSVTLGESYGASLYFVLQKRPGKTVNHLLQAPGDTYWTRKMFHHQNLLNERKNIKIAYSESF